MSASAILLAAGESTRMGQNKALLPWAGKTLLEFHLEQLQQTSADETIVVLGFEAEKLLPLVEKVARTSAVINPDYSSGKCSSIIAGVRTLSPQSEAVIILAVDQPRPYYLLQELIEWHLSHDNLISLLTYQGKRGHPPIFSRSLFSELLEISEAAMGLRQVIGRHRDQIADLPVSSPVALINLNNPGAYEKARSLFSSPNSG